MASETEVVTCPACKHLLRVPADWLGQPVQCPECQAKFAVPTRTGDILGDAVLITPPPAVGKTEGKPADAALWLPAFGLMLVGIAGFIVNGYSLAAIARDPDGYEKIMKAQAEVAVKLMGQDPQRVADHPLYWWQSHAAFAGWGILCATAAFAGGLGIVLRKWPWAARIGCIAAGFNFAGGCCLPGAVFGVWGFLLLRSEEGHEHFK